MKSRTLVSIIIPTYNNAESIDKCLFSITNQTYKAIEIVVVDNNSSDNTKMIAKKYTNLVFNGGPERSAQRNLGAKKSKGNYLLFVDSDMALTEKVVEECMKKILSKKYICALVIPEKSIGIGYWAQCKALERSYYVGINWIEAARLFNRDIFFQLNGYDEKNTGTEDYDLPQRLIKLKGKDSVNRIEEYIVHNEGKLSLTKALSKKLYYGKGLDRYINTNTIAFKRQSNIFARYILFFSNPKKLLVNPLVSVGMIFMKTCEFIAGGLGYCLRRCL
ncbi:MAG: glycosyltransferase family A protein [Candidatus Roizmanbacteria bacterium]|nr:glycosyltransferase family A protein [Candidatus Roizmanbacteria bacterium]